MTTYRFIVNIKSRQQGVATLLLTVLLLMLVSGLTVYGGRIAGLETRTASNILAQNEAYQAAAAGMRQAITKVNRNAIQQCDKDATQAVCANDGNNDGFSTYRVCNPARFTGVVCNLAIDPNVDDDRFMLTYQNTVANNWTRLQVTAVGVSVNDSKATQTLVQTLNYTPFIRNKFQGATVVKGAADASGSSVLTATDSDVTVWSGGAAAVSATTSISSGSGGVYGNDANLSGLSYDQFFENFFSSDRDTIHAMGRQIDCAAGCTDADLKQAGSVISDKVIVINGNLTLSQNTQLGSATDPVILIVTGNLTMNHNSATINGVAYVEENFVNGSGKGNINGALAVEGDFETTGGLNLTHNQAILNAMDDRRGAYAPVVGTWWE